MDTLAPLSMKSVARYEKPCELQSYTNHELLERTLRLFDQKKRQFCLSVENMMTWKCPFEDSIWVVMEVEISSKFRSLKFYRSRNFDVEMKDFLQISNGNISRCFGTFLAFELGWTLLTSTSGQSRLPAEFKHINKRRKRKQQWFHQ